MSERGVFIFCGWLRIELLVQCGHSWLITSQFPPRLDKEGRKKCAKDVFSIFQK